MSAREELIKYTSSSFTESGRKHISDLLDRLLDEHAHELAEEIRDRVGETVKRYGPSESDQGALDAADLIDPEMEC